MAESTTTTIEERTEVTVPHTGGCQETHRLAHFLKPTMKQGLELPLPLPHLNPSPPNWPLKLHLKGWPDKLRYWQEWVQHMKFAYGCVWRKLGIYDAIMASTLRFSRKHGLIIALAERWCPETNTFVFPWGEATLTLEDMLVLGGFPVLGHPVSLPQGDGEAARTWDRLENTRQHLERINSDTYSGWLHCYWNTSSNLEHEAFLALWLAWYVFPSECDGRVTNSVFRIAVHLARGTRLALAQAVLASIYHDLGVAKESMVASTRLGWSEVTLWSPFQFVQAWAWERLPTLCPRANVLGRNDVRLARWSDCKGYDIGNFRPAIISAGDTFLWRPYSFALDGWCIPSLYMENEGWLECDDDLGDEFKSWLRCLRACVLVGVDCVEPYNPHRVCMQFGYDQDLPGWVTREPNVSADTALYHDEKLYVPARLYQGDWSRAYAQWWRNTVLCLSTPFYPVLRKRKRRARRNCTNLGFGCVADVPLEFALTMPGRPKENISCCDKPKLEEFPGIPPGFEDMFNTTGHSIIRKDVGESSSTSGVAKVLETPPGFDSCLKIEKPLEFAPRMPGRPKENISCSHTPKIEDFPEIPPGFEDMFNTTVHSIIQKDVAKSSSNSGVARVLETPPGFSSKNADVPPGFDSSLKIGKRNSKSILKQKKKRACPAAANMSIGLDDGGPLVRKPPWVGTVTGAEYRMNVLSQKVVQYVGGRGTAGSSKPVAELLEDNLSKFDEYVGALRESVQICKNSSSMELRAQVPMIKARIVSAVESFNAED